MKNWKRYILPAALLLVILICVCRPSARPDHDRPHVIRIENVDGKNRQVQVIQDGVELALLDGEPHNVAVNLEGTRAFFILAPGKFDPGTVYKVENGELTVLAENVDDIYMSQNFKAFYYTHGDDELSVWQEGKHTHLGKCDPILNYKTISPDGQIVGFSLHDAAYYYMDGKTVKFGDHMNWMAIADGGRYLYFRDTDARKYYVQRGFDESTRMELPGMPGVMNSDLSQAMLSDYSPETGWHTWILVEGQKVMDLGDQGNWFPVIPQTLDREIDDLRQLCFTVDDYRPVSWEGAIYHQKNEIPDLYQISRSFKPRLVAEDLGRMSPVQSWDWKHLYVMGWNGTLQDICRVDRNRGTVKELERGRCGLTYTELGDGIYYGIPRENGVWYIEGNKRPKRLAGSENWEWFRFSRWADDGETMLLSAEAETPSGETVQQIYVVYRGVPRLLMEKAGVKWDGFHWNGMNIRVCFEKDNGEPLVYLYPRWNLRAVWEQAK